MEHAFNNIASVAPFTVPVTRNNRLIEAEQKIKKYKPLLHQIAISFGFSNVESSELVQEACLLAYHRYAKQEIYCPLKVFLAKCIIHKCIFKISSQLFSQNATARTYTCNCLYTRDVRLQEMPLNLRAVYILNIKFKFNEIEMAEILNTKSALVKERLQKALAFMKTH